MCFEPKKWKKVKFFYAPRLQYISMKIEHFWQKCWQKLIDKKARFLPDNGYGNQKR
jgi:hypothetical protein